MHCLNSSFSPPSHATQIHHVFSVPEKGGERKSSGSAYTACLVSMSGTSVTAKGGKQYTHRCKHGRHPARRLHTHHCSEPILSWLWQAGEKAVVAALASVRLWHWSCATGPLLGVSGGLSRSSRSHSLVCPVRAVLGGCRSTPAGSTRASHPTRERGARPAPKLWSDQSRSASAQKSRGTTTRARFSLLGERTGSVGRTSGTPAALARGALSVT